MFINKINIILSFIAAVLFSVFLPLTSPVQFWIPVLVFLVSYIALFILSWLVFGIISLTVSMKKEYTRISGFYNFMFNLGYGYLCELARLKIHVTGLEKLPEEKYLLVSNHRSNYDNMVQSYVLRKKTRLSYISKSGNFKIPIGRRFMKRNCYLEIDRENPRRALGTFLKAAELIKSGEASVGVFPEGHRNRDGRTGEFKSGCFLAASKAGCPVVVCSVTGTENITKNFPFRKTDVYFDVLEVIPAQTVKNTRTAALSDSARQMIDRHIEGADK